MLKEFTALIHVCSLWFPWQVDQVLHSFRICIPVFEKPGFVEFARHLHMWRDGRIYRMNFCVILIHVVPSRFLLSAYLALTGREPRLDFPQWAGLVPR